MGLTDLVPFTGDSTGIVPDWANSILDPLKDFVTGGTVTKIGQGIANFFTPGFPSLTNPSTPSTTSPTQGGPLFPSSTGTSGDDTDYSTIRQKMIDHLGFAPRRKAVYRMIRELGFTTASAVLGIDQSDGIWLYTHRRTGTRRHFVQTMIRQIRRAEGFRHQLSRYCGRLPRRRAAGAAPRRRRRR